MIQKHNEKFSRGEVTFNMGMNTFGDLTYDEFLKLFIMREKRRKRSTQTSLDDINDKIPSNSTIKKVNGIHLGDEKRSISSIPRESCAWTELAAVKSVKDQGDCKSGWAYSAVDAIAARYQVHYNKSCPSLSIPYLIHCSAGVGNHGCKGGLAENACRLVENTKQMPQENSLKKNTCSLNRMKNTVALNIKHCVTRPHTNMNISKELCTRGPVSASISAENPSFQFAKEGIYYEEDYCDKTPNHEVLLVGYNGSDKNNSYWIVKNSFGASWGEKGFLKISTKANKAGCTIIGDVSYPVF